MIEKLTNRYKQMRTHRYLQHICHGQYAFVGMGQHSLTNLYPVLNYLGVPLKYICVTSERKARLIEQKFPNVKATTSLHNILSDETIRGIFVSATPAAHYSIATQVLRSGKSLFIEKPPCLSLAEFDTLIGLQQLYGSPAIQVGLQQRYAPAVELLKRRLHKERLINYDLHYLTGALPEGNALYNLYIHPVDMVCHLFGKPAILACQKVASHSYIVMLQHTDIVGTMELSTAYNWTEAEETLKVCTHVGVYNMRQMDTLTYLPTAARPLAIPLEKLFSRHQPTEILYQPNNFTPTMANNQVVSQGYFGEIAAFVDAVEGRKHKQLTGLKTVRSTYELLSELSGQRPNR